MKKVYIHKVTHGLNGELDFPGDKSLTHRAIIFGSLAEGDSHFTNVLPGEDCVSTREAFREMGVEMRVVSPTELIIRGKGLASLRTPKKELYLGNSGTSMRLLLGVLAGQPFKAVLTGDASLSMRPMRRVTDYLRKMGAVIEGRDNANFAPLTIIGGPLEAIDANIPIASAQVKSAILLAGLYAKGTTRVTEPLKSRDHTERFLKYFGVPLRAKSFTIAGDISSAAFFMAAAVLVSGSEVTFRSVLWNPTRTGVVDVLKRMGAQFKIYSVHEEGPEPVCDFSLKSQELRAFEIRPQEVPTLVDELPILMVLATQAKGTSVVHDASELRVKETDRIHSMVSTLSAMGAKIRAVGNSVEIQGPTPLSGTRLHSFKDHRTAMSLVVAGLIADGQTIVEDIECINTSFPNFFELLGRLGYNKPFA